MCSWKNKKKYLPDNPSYLELMLYHHYLLQSYRVIFLMTLAMPSEKHIQAREKCTCLAHQHHCCLLIHSTVSDDSLGTDQIVQMGICCPHMIGSVRVAELLALTTSDHKVLVSNLTRGGIQLKTVWGLIARSLSLSFSIITK